VTYRDNDRFDSLVNIKIMKFTTKVVYLNKSLEREKKTCVKMLRVVVKIVILVIIYFLKFTIAVLESIGVAFVFFF